MSGPSEVFMTAQPSIESFFNDFEDALSDIGDDEDESGASSLPPLLIGGERHHPRPEEVVSLRHWASLGALERKRASMSQRSRSASDFHAPPQPHPLRCVDAIDLLSLGHMKLDYVVLYVMQHHGIMLPC